MTEKTMKRKGVRDVMAFTTDGDATNKLYDLRRELQQKLHLSSLQELEQTEGAWKGPLVGLWRAILVMIDSGAGSSAAPTTMATAVPLVPSRLSQAGITFATATGESVPTKGKRTPLVALPGGALAKATFEIREGLDRPIMSVSELNAAGYSALFYPTSGWLHTPTGGWIKLLRRNGTFWLKCFMAPGQENEEVTTNEEDHTPNNDINTFQQQHHNDHNTTTTTTTTTMTKPKVEDKKSIVFQQAQSFWEHAAKRREDAQIRINSMMQNPVPLMTQHEEGGSSGSGVGPFMGPAELL